MGEVQSEESKGGEETKLWALDSPNNQIEESKGGEETKLWALHPPNNQSKESKGGETKLWAPNSPNNQNVRTRLTKQPKCEHLIHQTTKVWAPDSSNKQIMSTWPTKQIISNCEHYLDSPNNQTNWKRIQIKPNWTKRTMQRQIDEPIWTTMNQAKPNETKPTQTIWTKQNQTRQIEKPN